MRGFTPEQQAGIVASYQAGRSSITIGRENNATGPTILRLLRAKGVEVRHRSRRYAVDEGFFSDVDCDEKAYVLGFVSADGSITRTGHRPDGPNTLSITLKRDDEALLHAIRRAMRSDHPIRRYDAMLGGRAYPASALAWFSPRIAADLVALGVKENKTRSLDPWGGPAGLMPSYWRGFLDGDGCWGQYSTGGCKVRFRCCTSGTRAMCEGFRDFVAGLGGRRPAVIQLPTTKAVFVSHLPTVKLLAAAVYDGATIWLERKRAVAEAALTFVPTRRSPA